MQEVRVQYNGVDTINLRLYGKFDAYCEIARQQDLISIVGRSDVQAFVAITNREKEHPLKYADVNSIFKNAKEEYSLKENKVEECLKGSTFVTLMDALKLQHCMRRESSHFINITYKVHDICGLDVAGNEHVL
jgi:hypothetical protein